MSSLIPSFCQVIQLDNAFFQLPLIRDYAYRTGVKGGGQVKKAERERERRDTFCEPIA